MPTTNTGLQLSQSNKPPVYTTGTLAGTSDRFLLDVTGLASAMIHIQGTGVMTLKFGGTADLDGVGSGGRRLWKSGTGSLGTSIISVDGSTTPVDSEYRVILGGSFLSIDVTSYTSGSIAVSVLADANSPIAFIGGPVTTPEEDSALGGRLFNVSTGFIAINSNQYLNCVFENPASSRKVAIIRGRRFGMSANGLYGGISTPTTATFDSLTGSAAPVVVPIANARTGGVASTMTFKYNASATRIDSSPSNTNPSGGFIQAYQDSTLNFLRVVPPGFRFGNFIGGPAVNGLGGTMSGVASITYYWIEQDVA